MTTDRVLTGWQKSGFRRIAHYIWRSPTGVYLEAACGATWWQSDCEAARPAAPDDPRCKTCAKSKAARDA